MRNWLNAARSYIEPVEIGATMRALGIGHVIASRDGKFKPGDLVSLRLRNFIACKTRRRHAMLLHPRQGRSVLTHRSMEPSDGRRTLWVLERSSDTESESSRGPVHLAASTRLTTRRLTGGRPKVVGISTTSVCSVSLVSNLIPSLPNAS